MCIRDSQETEQLIQEVLEVYPEATGKQRAKHLMANDPTLEKSNKCIVANKKALPGVMTARGCAYAGAKGVVWGPVKDVANISPVSYTHLDVYKRQVLYRP